LFFFVCLRYALQGVRSTYGNLLTSSTALDIFFTTLIFIAAVSAAPSHKPLYPNRKPHTASNGHTKTGMTVARGVGRWQCMKVCQPSNKQFSFFSPSWVVEDLSAK